MIITSFNEGGFKIQTAGVVILTEPRDKVPARMKADIFIKTKAGESAVEGAQLIKGAGEYEIKGIEARGYSAYNYLIKNEDINLGLISDFSVAADKITGVDIVLAITIDGAATALRQMQPKIVVVSGDVKELEKELGLKAEKLDKLTIKNKDLTDKELRLVSL